MVRIPTLCHGRQPSEWVTTTSTDQCEWEVSPGLTVPQVSSSHTTTECSASDIILTPSPSVSTAPTPKPVSAPTQAPSPLVAGECPAAPPEPQDRRTDKSKLKVGGLHVTARPLSPSRLPPPASRLQLPARAPPST